MTPARPLDLAAFNAEVARQVNVRLAEQAKPGAMPEVVLLCTVGRVLSGFDIGPNSDLIRETAAQVTAEMGAK